MSEPTSKIVFNPEGSGTGDACIPNISPIERKKRLRFGIAQVVVTTLILVTMLAFGVDKLWRLPLFALYSAGTVSMFQAFDKT